ncbi:MAG TPA: DUF3024 domain-containing protein [Fodinibius sp.]|nr:DUF3024 domain-containing protein [Fodinibius sp.]
MSFTKEELNQWEPIVRTFIERSRPPEHLRSQVDLAYTIDDQNIIIFEIRPQWDDPETKVKNNVAKATWVRSQQVWKIYWQKRDLKWHPYEPLPKVDSLETFIKEVDEDPNACFLG